MDVGFKGKEILFWNSLEIFRNALMNLLIRMYSTQVSFADFSPFGKEYHCMYLFYQCMHLSVALCRTARGDNQGSALSFVSVKDMDLLGEVEKALSESGSEYNHKHRIRQWVHSLTQNLAVSTLINTESGSEYTDHK